VYKIRTWIQGTTLSDGRSVKVDLVVCGEPLYTWSSICNAYKLQYICISFLIIITLQLCLSVNIFLCINDSRSWVSLKPQTHLLHFFVLLHIYILICTHAYEYILSIHIHLIIIQQRVEIGKGRNKIMNFNADGVANSFVIYFPNWVQKPSWIKFCNSNSSFSPKLVSFTILAQVLGL